MTAGSRAVVENNCRYCHQGIAHDVSAAVAGTGTGIACIRCHRDVGHP
jgi:hypothetical protein